MHCIILGAGSTGTQLARRLSEEGKDVALIERDPDKARITANALDCLVVQGDGSSLKILEQAGIAKADFFIALTESDEVNIVACSMVAAEHKGVHSAARVRNPYFSQLDTARRSFMGIDRFVNPDIETARALRDLAISGGSEGIVRFSGEELMLRASKLTESSAFVGKPLMESRAALGLEFLVAALEGPDGFRVPSGDTVPEAGETIYLLGSKAVLVSIMKAKLVTERHFRKIIIAGGRSVGQYLAQCLLGKDRDGDPSNEGHGPKRTLPRELIILDPSTQICKKLAREVPEALVINRALDDEELFLEEGLAGADLFIAATEDQHLNLLTASRAKRHGIDRCLALLYNNSYIDLAPPLGVDGVISVKTNIVSSIIEYMHGGLLRTLYSFFDRGLKVLEFTVKEGGPMDGRKISDLRLPKGALVIFVKRDGKTSLPAGNTVLESGDQGGILTSMKAIRRIEEIFLGKDA